MAERTADVQAHWTRPGVLTRIDAALAELGQDPQILTPEILATVEHLHSGGLAYDCRVDGIDLTPETQVPKSVLVPLPWLQIRSRRNRRAIVVGNLHRQPASKNLERRRNW